MSDRPGDTEEPAQYRRWAVAEIELNGAATAAQVADGCFLSSIDMVEIKHVELIWRPCKYDIQGKVDAGCCCGGSHERPTNNNGARVTVVHLGLCGSHRVSSLSFTARKHDLGAATQEEFDLMFDNPGKLLAHSSLCVVLGNAKGSPMRSEQRHCLLIITPVAGQGGNVVYERIGAGFLPGKCISPPTGLVHIY
ncbi:hypothetical protein BU25DRAFT_27006 [Macroventuria anomochaeta]|uniref:Uncharacterized protein n=1 Tax=Macroventuria anomochaeta TaxID=301207 RepID=A0ACB6S4L9_9PLEO|nr:uncharacterized protein BU25DRAFT_27006 [Macroventuria anomochaeta]KAF2629111.1 hypothetical protein BU25DRAFT_27006 [Macroventuria anomochaeta]